MYGNIVLASTKGQFIPNAIKWFTNSQFSHSLVTVPNVLGVSMCIEAVEGGVDFARFDNGYENNQDQGYEIWNVKVDQAVKDKAIVSILNDLEIGYGFLEYAFFICRRFCLLFGIDIKNQNNWISQGMICSQLCVAYLKACGLDRLFIHYGNGAVAPQDLQDIFKANPDLFEKTSSVRLEN
jgi:hypothetical protein